MFLCLVLHLPEWRPIVDSIVNPTLKFEVYREKFDPSFSLVKNAKNSEPDSEKNKLPPAISTSFPRSGTRSELNFSRATLQGMPCLVSKFLM